MKKIEIILKAVQTSNLKFETKQFIFSIIKGLNSNDDFSEDSQPSEALSSNDTYSNPEFFLDASPKNSQNVETSHIIQQLQSSINNTPVATQPVEPTSQQPEQDTNKRISKLKRGLAWEFLKRPGKAKNTISDASIDENNLTTSNRPRWFRNVESLISSGKIPDVLHDKTLEEIEEIYKPNNFGFSLNNDNIGYVYQFSLPEQKDLALLLSDKKIKQLQSQLFSLEKAPLADQKAIEQLKRHLRDQQIRSILIKRADITQTRKTSKY